MLKSWRDGATNRYLEPMKHSIFTLQPLEDQRWLIWPDVARSHVYEGIRADLKDYRTVTVDFSFRESITIDEARQLIMSVPRKNRSYFGLWGMSDAVKSTIIDALSGK